MVNFEKVPLSVDEHQSDLLTILDRKFDQIHEESIENYEINLFRDVLVGNESFLSGNTSRTIEQLLRSTRETLSNVGVTEEQFRTMVRQFVERFQKMQREDLEKRLFDD